MVNNISWHYSMVLYFLYINNIGLKSKNSISLTHLIQFHLGSEDPKCLLISWLTWLSQKVWMQLQMVIFDASVITETDAINKGTLSCILVRQPSWRKYQICHKFTILGTNRIYTYIQPPLPFLSRDLFYYFQYISFVQCFFYYVKHTHTLQFVMMLVVLDVVCERGSAAYRNAPEK